MVKVTLSKVMYDLLMTILNRMIQDESEKFSRAALNSEEESHASIRMSVLMDILAALVATAEEVRPIGPANKLIHRN